MVLGVLLAADGHDLPHPEAELAAQTLVVLLLAEAPADDGHQGVIGHLLSFVVEIHRIAGGRWQPESGRLEGVARKGAGFGAERRLVAAVQVEGAASTAWCGKFS